MLGLAIIIAIHNSEEKKYKESPENTEEIKGGLELLYQQANALAEAGSKWE